MIKYNHSHVIRIILLVSIIALAFWASGFVKDNEFISGLINKFGYVGVLLVAVISGFNLVIPIPAISFFPIFLASELNAPLIIIVIAAGMTLADFIGYLLGRAGRHIVPSSLERKVANNFEKLQRKFNLSPALALFLFASFAPFPNEVIVIPMAFLGYKPIYILVPILLGNIIFNTIYALGAINILKLIT